MPASDVELKCLQQQVERVFTQPVTALVKLNKGLSNKNYLLYSGQGKRLLKCYSHDIPVAALSAQNKLAQQQVTSQVLAFDQPSRLAIFTFLPEVERSPVLGKDLLEQLVRVHQLELDVYEQLDLLGYLNQLSATLQTRVDMAWIRSQLASLPSDMAFCHNDLVLSNIIVGESKVQLIDFEYACHNDLFFDLAALVCSFGCTVAQAHRVLQNYFMLRQQEPPVYSQTKLKLYCQIYLLLSIEWYEQRGVEDEAATLRAALLKWVD
ncbi:MULTISPECIES: phosphotransferase [unclassified Pseudoalteromonas]|uniref:phosphotransferase n=1 Tax=unclassified Pseudoalteromonas TaxID=194690 RepID=UPI0030155D5B